MSAYKLIKVSKNTSGQESQGLYDYTDLNEAIAAMNNDFGVAVKSDETVSVYCLVIDNETGTKVDSRYWKIDADPEAEEQVDTVIRSRVYTHNDYSNDNIAPYDSERLAIGNYHTKLAASMRKAECNHAITILINSVGEFSEFSDWTREE